MRGNDLLLSFMIYNPVLIFHLAVAENMLNGIMFCSFVILKVVLELFLGNTFTDLSAGEAFFFFR